MSEAELMKCVCSEQPKLESETSWSGGGRHRGAERCDSWKVNCKCYRYEEVIVYGKTEAESEEARKRAIAAWNERATREWDRKRSKDKLLWDLEHSSDITKRALARILKAVEKEET